MNIKGFSCCFSHSVLLFCLLSLYTRDMLSYVNEKKWSCAAFFLTKSYLNDTLAKP